MSRDQPCTQLICRQMLRHAAQTLSEALHGNVRNSGMSAIRQWYSVKVVVPQMGDSISEGSVAAVLKQPGEQVKENDAILQIETDKVSVWVCIGTVMRAACPLVSAAFVWATPHQLATSGLVYCLMYTTQLRCTRHNSSQSHM